MRKNQRPQTSGNLHKQMGVTAGKPVPHAALEHAARCAGMKGKRARLALNLRRAHDAS